MAVVATAATVVAAGATAYSAYQGYQSAQDAQASLEAQDVDRYRQAQSIDAQISAEADLYAEEQGLLEAEHLIGQDKLDLASRKAVSGLDYKQEALGLAGAKSEEGLKAGLEKTLMQGATGFRQAGTQQRQAMAASGFAGAGVGQESGMRDAMSQIQFAQRSQATQYGQEQSMLAMQGRELSSLRGFQAEGADLAEESLAQQYERSQFGAHKEYEQTVGSLEARQQSLVPGYSSSPSAPQTGVSSGILQAFEMMGQGGFGGGAAFGGGINIMNTLSQYT